ncbi:39S ribosomal protein L13, mitochondrial [Aplysia californica]|uniref:39S ribosomal protein L13, mitochondrial n=1 Tax=Aplysia californica TaxID=6500 RepID=A0ABM0K381_APLCA|nr:39S ribosomal protein L13, mitochondrial [Aplysia californica]
MANNRVLQWAVMARTWWIYDANLQCPFRSSERIITYLKGKHKPIYHPFADIGDHVVVFNTRHVAMRGNFWRTFKHFNHTRYAGGFSQASAWRVHEMDPTRIMEKACYQRLSGLPMKKTLMARLHLYPDEEIPQEILENVSGQIRQVQVVPKKLEDYTEEEIQNFPRLFEWPENYDVESYQRENQQEPDQHTTKKWRLD